MTQRPAAAALAERLASDGYAVAGGYFDPVLCMALEQEALALATDADAINAGIGRGAAHTTDALVRRARIRWLDGASPAQKQFLAETDALRLGLNRTLFLGLETFEAQLALTPVGGFYRRHVDSFQGQRSRIVSLVAYLNPEWTEADGGCLRIYAGERVIDVSPVAATLVLMLSEDIAHEVLPGHRQRASVAGWFRVRAVAANAVKALF